MVFVDTQMTELPVVFGELHVDSSVLQDREKILLISVKYRINAITYAYSCMFV